jgi:tRNA nucleotidyltransferase (CCA-adding enzyme)
VLGRLYGELADVGATAAALDRAAERGLPLAARFAVLATGCRSPQEASALLDKLRLPQDAAQLARLAVELREPLQSARDPSAVLDMLERGDAFRRPDRFEQLLQAFEVSSGQSASRVRAAARAAAGVDAGTIAAAHRNDPAAIAKAIRAARLDAVAHALEASD